MGRQGNWLVSLGSHGLLVSSAAVLQPTVYSVSQLARRQASPQTSLPSPQPMNSKRGQLLKQRMPQTWSTRVCPRTSRARGSSSARMKRPCVKRPTETPQTASFQPAWQFSCCPHAIPQHSHSITYRVQQTSTKANVMSNITSSINLGL